MSAFTLSGCTGLSDVASGDVKLPTASNWFNRPTWTSVTARAATRREITTNDLIAADGSCAGVAVASPEPAAGDAGVAPATSPLVPGGIAIDMTECEVVQRAGQPDNFQIGSDERGERALVLTYARGPKPGTYKFTAGRLVAMERGPEPPPAPKPTKPAKQPAKPAPRRA